jgi:hypothetical protein
MLRDFSRKKTTVNETLSLDEDELKTVLFAEADQFRITALYADDDDPTQFNLLWRCVSENEDRSARAADTVDAGFELVAAQCAPISSRNPSTGWIDAQPAGIRLQAVGGPVDVVVEYTTSVRFTWDTNAVTP